MAFLWLNGWICACGDVCACLQQVKRKIRGMPRRRSDNPELILVMNDEIRNSKEIIPAHGLYELEPIGFSCNISITLSVLFK